jgi:hypothetical protein
LSYGDIAVAVGNNPSRTVNMDNHVRAESGWASYPSFANTHSAAYIITQAYGDGSTQTYTAPNNYLKAGDTVNITGTGLDGTNLTVASANRYTFTVAGAGTGSYINISGKVRYTDELTANDGAYIAGVAYVVVPNVLGLTTALATDAMTDAELVPSTAAAYTPAVNSLNITSYVATLATTAAHGFAVGDVVTIAGLSTTAANGTWTLIAGTAGTTLKFATPLTQTVAGTSDSGTAKVAARAGTVFSQSVAAGAASIATGTAVTLTPYAA